MRYIIRTRTVSPFSLSRTIELSRKVYYESNKGSSSISRYSPYRYIIDSMKKKIYESQNNTSIINSDSDTFHKVSFIEINRLDLISMKYYNSTQYWWIIAKANNIIDPFSLNMDTILRIPSLQSVYSSKGVVK